MLAEWHLADLTRIVHLQNMTQRTVPAIQIQGSDIATLSLKLRIKPLSLVCFILIPISFFYN
jgi:hypothetical protein